MGEIPPFFYTGSLGVNRTSVVKFDGRLVQLSRHQRALVYCNKENKD